MKSEILKRWEKFCERRDRALATAVRTVSEVQVVVATKYHTPAELAEHVDVVAEFPRDWGENYYQELARKAVAPELQNLGLKWHYFGALQSKKILPITEVASTIHSVGRVKELEMLAKILKDTGSLAKFYVQFNVSIETTKNGFEVEEATLAAETVQKLGLDKHCLGLMCSAAPIEDQGLVKVREAFVRLRELRDRHFKGKKLNMGMSADFDLAIAEGSDVIRVGTTLVGNRNNPGL